MKIIKLEQNTPEWLEARRGKITGSKLKDVITKRGNTKKIGYYQLIADKLALVDEPEDAMQRGHDLEQEAIDAFIAETGKIVESNVGMWVHDEHPDIAISPDAVIKVGDKYKQAVEVKCLNSARHIQAIIENKVPADYYDQQLQYFVVNQDLVVLYFVFYDPRLTAKPLHIIEVNRDDIEEDIQAAYDSQVAILNEVSDWVEKLGF